MWFRNLVCYASCFVLASALLIDLQSRAPSLETQRGFIRQLPQQPDDLPNFETELELANLDSNLKILADIAHTNLNQFEQS